MNPEQVRHVPDASKPAGRILRDCSRNIRVSGIALLLAGVTTGLAENGGNPGILDQIDFRYNLKIQSSVTQEQPADSSLNPDNAILAIPEWNYNSQMRLDLFADYGPVSFLIKPRLVGQRSEFTDGPLDGESESDQQLYINEWQLRLAIADQLYVSYGRENLQWGPAYLYSPSNPFNQDNGQNNPKGELPGMDYGKAIWVPNKDWTASFIANVGEGEANLTRNIDSQYNTFVDEVGAQAQAQVDDINRQYQQGLAQIDQLRNSAPGTRGPIAHQLNAQADQLDAIAKQQRDAGLAEVTATTDQIYSEAALQRETYNKDFQNQYAVKVDYTTLQKYVTLITSYHETDKTDESPERIRLGSYAGWTASDALLLYTEASASLRGEELYPVADPESPLGLRLAQTRLTENDFRGTVLAGGTYTFESGQTIVAEYLYNGVGYDQSQANDYYALRDKADAALLEDEPLATLGYLTLAQAEDVGMHFIRRNYLLLQYQQLQIVGNLGFVLRSTINLDDGSAQLIPVFQYNIAERWQIFAIMNQNVGSRNTEFTSVYDHAYQVGIELTL